MTQNIVLDIRAGEARVNITVNGQNGDMQQPIAYDATDEQIKNWATEAIQAGNVPGIDPFPNPDFTNYRVDRFPPKEEVPFARVSLRPKTEYGS